MEWDPSVHPPRENYGLLTSAVCPRPIAWVTTEDPGSGVVNAAPFSWFQSVCADPPMVMLALADRRDGAPKDTLRNILSDEGYVINVATRGLASPLVASSGDYPPEESEVAALGLETTPSRRVRPPRLAASPIHLECRLHDVRRLGRKAGVAMVLGEVVHAHVADEVLDGAGRIDPRKVPFLARLGGAWYSAVTPETLFEVPRPGQADALRRG